MFCAGSDLGGRRRNLLGSFPGDRAGASRLQSELFGWTGRQPDAREGVMAFLGKRAPEWKLSKSRDLPENLP